MNRFALLFALTAWARLSHAQAVVVPEVEPAAPSFPEPEATPLGAGSSHGSLVSPERELAPRSPNRRVLPASAEPGVWAADAPRGAAREPTTIAGFEILVPDTDGGDFQARFCASQMERFIRSEGQMAAIEDLRADDRQCVAARLEAYCWESDIAKATDDARRGELTAVLQQIQAFVRYACRNTAVPKPKVDKVVAAVKRAWDITAQQRERVPARRRRP